MSDFKRFEIFNEEEESIFDERPRLLVCSLALVFENLDLFLTRTEISSSTKRSNIT